MTPDEIELALERAESALADGRNLKGTGFWRAVSEVRRSPALAERYADRIAAVDRRAFELGVKLRVPIAVGVAVLTLGTGVGIALLYAGVAVDYSRPSWVSPLLFVAGLGAVIVSSHSLAHWIVGEVVGIRFTHVFVAGVPPEPGVKIDYASYLKTPPRSRALMHASGAVVTKLIPFVLLPSALVLYDRRPWLTWILLVVGVVLILTDVFFSTKVSDWMKVRRELAAGR